MAFDPTEPFVLLDDARPGGKATLFTKPRDSIVAVDRHEIPASLDRLARPGGLWLAGFIGFEAGYALEPRLVARLRAPADGLPFLWFGRFAERRTLHASEVDSLLGDRRGSVRGVAPHMDQGSHRHMVAAAQRLIEAGDIYQANITFAADVDFDGDALGLYRLLRAAQAAPYGALVHTGDAWALSFSPELFFEIDGRRIVTRPMKGTAARSPVPAADRAAAAALAADPKNRAENLMIVDLLRNDLSRVSDPGSVEVVDLFGIETYPTIHQMTSTVAARLADGIGAADVLRALFPCGSVTGAPKVRAMEVIAEIEDRPRGLYTGSIGSIAPDGSARFNVAIRTIVIDGSGRATIGLGSGIVADSDPASEWAECLIKARFLTRRPRRFDLIETLRFTPGLGAERLDRHLDRMARSAAHWGFAFDRQAAIEAVAATAVHLTSPSRLRIMLGHDGGIAVQGAPLPPAPEEPVAVALADLPIAATDPRLFHKTSDRAFYDDARARAGTFELLFRNARGELTEGSFTNLFVPRGGKLLTAPLAAGLLPGVLRAELIERGAAVEATLTQADLDGEFFIGNSLRGLIRARLRQ